VDGRRPRPADLTSGRRGDEPRPACTPPPCRCSTSAGRAIGFDGDGEAVPSNCEGVMYPIHAIGVNAMGLYFLDSLFLEDLAAACEVQGRWEFLLVIAPLRLAAGTGSPVNPIAVL